jgi:hypothetical protein
MEKRENTTREKGQRDITKFQRERLGPALNRSKENSEMNFCKLQLLDANH